MDLFIDYPDGNVNFPSEQQIEKDTPEAVKAKLREHLDKWPDDLNAGTSGINNHNPLALLSGHGGATPAAFGAVAPTGWYPTKPGRQFHDRRDDVAPVSRAEFLVLVEQVRARGCDVDEMAAIVVKLTTGKGAR
ncbi:hypothetical protein J8F10_30405 [Gemmata sp. G18]|uniref:Uncharacterized protein n=1 Tax=Gemmata palustris TaxID=2822762 RepID=A0ABS5C352_9BACT|nr:hypothetical protein [Gemmata palustris]MBP3959578.1 hypothetical protein [Gemmata palustris]